MPNLTLSVLPETFSICRLDPNERVPDWADAHSFVSITRTADELSIVCLDKNVPTEVNANRGWRCLKVEVPFDTDYVLVKEQALTDAIAVLEEAGHIVKR